MVSAPRALASGAVASSNAWTGSYELDVCFCAIRAIGREGQQGEGV
jgi:hypothetical protein